MKEKDLPKLKSEININLLMKHSYLKEAIETSYFLVVVEKGELAEQEIPSIVCSILQEFVDIFF